jgi:hypothetical protein
MSFRVNTTNVIDANGDIIIGSGAANPASPANGTLWFNTTSGTLVGWNGTAWVTLTTA